MIPIIALTINLSLLVGIIYFIVFLIRKNPSSRKPNVRQPIEHKPKTIIRLIIETIVWIALAISSISYVYIKCRGSPLYWLVEIFWMIMIGFYVYDDSRKRYQKQSWNIAWAVAVGIFFPLFIIYFWVRPPATLEATGTRFKKKLVFSITATIICVISLGLLRLIFP